MFELERISIDAVPAALEKAERYRLLNEPLMAESICLDVLEPVDLSSRRRQTKELNCCISPHS